MKYGTLNWHVDAGILTLTLHRPEHRIDSLAVFYTQLTDGKEGIRAFLDKRTPEFASKASEMPPIYPWWK